MTKLPRYPLQVVRDLRVREQDAAQEAVAARLAEQAAEERKRQELQVERERLVAERAAAWEHLYDPGPDGTLDVRDIADRRAHIELLGKRIVAQDAAIAEADRRV